MNIETAGMIQFSKYKHDKKFEKACQFAKANHICEGNDFVYISHNGTIKNAAVLTRMAERANAIQKTTTNLASMQFVLSYLCAGFLDYELINQEATHFARKYNDAHAEQINESTAMAVILMLLIGYEQRKICILRKIVAYHNQKRQTDQTAPVWEIARAEEYNKYHIDVIVKNPDETIICGYQMECEDTYFKLLEFQQESTGLSDWQKHNMDDNRKQLNLFLEENPSATVDLLTYKMKDAGGYSILPWGIYTPVQPIF